MSEVNYKAVLADLRIKRKKLDEPIAGLEIFSGGESPASAGAESTQRVTGSAAGGGDIRPDTFFGMKTPDAVKRYLEIKKRPQKAANIAKGLEAGGFMSQAKNFYANVASVLRRLEDAGEVVRIGDTKKWAMAAWYPNRPKTKPKTNGESSGEENSDAVEAIADDGATGAAGNEGSDPTPQDQLRAV